MAVWAMRHLILMGLLVFTSLCLAQEPETIKEEVQPAPPQGYVEALVQDVRIEHSGSVVSIRAVDSNMSLDIHVSRVQGENIYMALHNITFSRPLTHDLILSFLENSGMRIKHISIDRLEEGIYYSTILTTGREGDVSVDARPSDSIVLALKVGAPIYVKKDLLEKERKAGKEFPEIEA